MTAATYKRTASISAFRCFASTFMPISRPNGHSNIRNSFAVQKFFGTIFSILAVFRW